LADITVNISDAEGFGLATLESLSCGTPIIANMTGGLQEQVVGAGDTYGIPIFPSSKSIIGSQQVPYIYEDRISRKDFLSALNKMYDMSFDERLEMGQRGHEYVKENYNFSNFNKSWVDLMTKIYETEGSWETRTGYNGIRFKEVA
jgi:glycosyltransferase involved in cell wall biosynthesis